MKKNIKMVFMILVSALIVVTSTRFAYAVENKKGVDVILMIDTSGSMDEEDRDPERHALNMADFFVRNLPDDDLRLGVYNFSNDVNVVFPFGKVTSEKTDKVKIHNKIKSLEYVGATDMGDAFETCADIWDTIKKDSSSRKQIILFLTDGEISLLDGESHEALELMKDSKKRMNEALDRIDCTICPVYVIAFGDEAVEGKDAKEAASREGNRFIPARDQATLLDAYNNVFENILGTKKVERKGIRIDKEHNEVALNNDDNQTGLNVNITKNENGSGNVLDDDISIINDETGQVWNSDDFEDYFDEYLGRLLKIPEELLKSGSLSLVFNTTADDVIDVKEYYLYDISCSWNTENGKSYEKGQDITFKISVNGIDTNSFVVYAIFEKDGKKKQEVIPDKVYSGEIAREVKIYGSSLEEEKTEKFSGVKMLLDTQDNSYQTTVAFNKLGDYKVHIYGENERGFTQSEELDFSIVKPSNPEEKESSWKDKLLEIFHMIVEWFKQLPLWGKGILAIIILFLVRRIFFSMFFRKVNND